MDEPPDVGVLEGERVVDEVGVDGGADEAAQEREGGEGERGSQWGASARRMVQESAEVVLDYWQG